MSLSAVLVRVIVEAVERTGVLRGDLLGPIGIDAGRLADVHGRFELHEFADLQTRAIELTGDDALGLHAAEHVTEAAFDLLAHLVSHAPTLRDALGLCTQFQRILTDDSQITLGEKGDLATLRYEFARSTERSDRMHAEFIMAAFWRLVRTFVGARAVMRRASFEHARPPYHSEYTRVFAGAERFKQPTTAIAFDRELLDCAQIHQHPALYAVLRSEAERTLEQVTAGLGTADRLKQYLLARPPSRIPDMAAAARDLGMSERSLRRRLASEATSYRLIVRAALETSAGHLLRDPARTIQSTAEALGFSDAVAFHRAFKRWTGMTPGQYRDRRR
jgi:AraC-like DNA-binding protein